MDYVDYDNKAFLEVPEYYKWYNILQTRLKREEDTSYALSQMFNTLDNIVIKIYDKNQLERLSQYSKIFIIVLLLNIVTSVFPDVLTTGIFLTMLISFMIYIFLYFDNQIKKRKYYLLTRKNRKDDYISNMQILLKKD